MKTIDLPTNYNGKLACRAIVHIARAMPTTVPAADMNQPYLFSTKDGSHEPVVFYLKDLVRIPAIDLPTAYTWASHGMSRVDFLNFLAAEYGMDTQVKLCVYFYHREADLEP